MCKGDVLEDVVGNERADPREDEDSEKSGTKDVENVDTMYELKNVHGNKMRERLAQRYKLLQEMQAKSCAMPCEQESRKRRGHLRGLVLRGLLRWSSRMTSHSQSWPMAAARTAA
jgi:hypothetical protein